MSGSRRIAVALAVAIIAIATLYMFREDSRTEVTETRQAEKSASAPEPRIKAPEAAPIQPAPEAPATAPEEPEPEASPEELAGPSVRVTGIVVDPRGVGITGATVEFRSPDVFTGMMLETDGSGVFEAESVTPGVYWVRATAEGYLFANSEKVRVLPVESQEPIRLLLVPAVEIERRVVDRGGNPVSLASVKVYALLDPSSTREAQSDSSGAFAMMVSGDGALRVRVDHPDYRGFDETFVSAAAIPPDLVLPSGAGFRFELVLPSHVELPCFYQLSISSVDSTTSMTATAEDPVIEKLGLSAGRYQFELTILPFETLAGTVQLAEDEVREFVYEPKIASEVDVVVFDSNGKPIEGARVLRLRSARYGRSGTSVGVTDEFGRLTVSGLVGEFIGVRVTAQGMAPVELPDVGSLVQDGTLEVTLEPEARLVVIARDASGGPIVGAQIQLSTRTSGLALIRGASSSDSNGRTSIGELESGPCFVQASYGIMECPRQRVELRAGTTTEVELTLLSPLAVRGVVRINGEPATGGELRFRLGSASEVTRVSGDGRFECPLNIGEYEITYTPGQGIEVDLGVHFVEAESELDLRYVGNTVSLRFIDPDGHAIDGARVALVEVGGGSHSASFPLDLDHPVVLEDFPSGRYEIQLRSLKAPNFGRRQEIVVSGSGEFTYVTESLKAIEPKFADRVSSLIEVQLIDEAGVGVDLFEQRTRPFLFYWPASFAGEGVVLMGGVPVFFQIDAEGAIQPAVLPVVQPGELRVTGPTTFRVEPIASPSSSLATGPLRYWRNREFSTFGPNMLAPGRYRVIAVGEPVAESQEVEIRAGRTTDVEF